MPYDNQPFSTGLAASRDDSNLSFGLGIGGMSLPSLGGLSTPMDSISTYSPSAAQTPLGGDYPGGMLSSQLANDAILRQQQQRQRINTAAPASGVNPTQSTSISTQSTGTAPARVDPFRVAKGAFMPLGSTQQLETQRGRS